MAKDPWKRNLTVRMRVTATDGVRASGVSWSLSHGCTSISKVVLNVTHDQRGREYELKD